MAAKYESVRIPSFEYNFIVPDDVSISSQIKDKIIKDMTERLDAELMRKFLNGVKRPMA